MSIDTKIDGDPASIRAVAGWLRDTLGSQLTTSADDLAKVRNLAESGWDGETGDAFTTMARNTCLKVDDFVIEVQGCATQLDALAGQVQQAQTEMATIRTNATTAGLVVKEQVIEAPAADADQDKVTAYNTAVTDANQVRQQESFWGNTWTNMQNDVKDKWFIVIGDFVNGAVGALILKNSSLLLANAALLSSDALKTLIEAKNAPAGTPRATLYRDVDWQRTQMLKAGEALEAAENAKAKGARIGLRVGGALAVAGIAYDIYNGKDPEQAIVSGAAGFGASLAAGMATGAGVGAAVGSIVPGAGTVAGAIAGTVVGGAVGIFTSGAVDSLYTEGFNLGAAGKAGWNAVEGTGAAIGGGVSKAWNAIF
ncbi:hypothetical protein JK358_07790 [Nocardia sp. 2]|uniref:WXG100 family type VII secretion target n=1 Tax=Nocardia acididurans TaxID=2802282 RepID=A0ABS1M1A2_9NOCA|nr:hypothetical protein [Nocardia acididurans]MBL1074296.1 hypothetical protein [Nocardia acididurans]